jgi:hypothetical protein
MVFVALLCAACSGGGANTAGPSEPATSSASRTPAPQARGTAVFVIKWPVPPSETERRRRDYFSNSTASVSIIANGGAPVIANNPALSPGGSGGTQTTSISIAVPVGSNNTFRVNDWEGLNGGGNLLASGSVGSVTITKDEANTIHITLRGNLANIVCAGTAPFVSPRSVPTAMPTASAPALTMVGPAGGIVLLPEDAGGNIIIMPGLIPSLALTAAVPSQATIASTSTGNEFNVNVLETNTAITLNTAGQNLAGTTVSGTCSVTRVEALYVANHDTFGPVANNPTVTIYPASANGDATPVATLAGSATAEDEIWFPAVDPSGTIYLSNENQGESTGSVTEFAPVTEHLNVAPVATIGGLYQPEGLALDASNNLYAGVEQAIDVFAPGASGTPATMLRQITGANTLLSTSEEYQVFVESTDSTPGKIDVAMQNEINTYAPGANGNVTPLQAIFGESTLLVSVLGVAADSSGNIYAADNTVNDIVEFSSTATGDTAPTAIMKSTSFDQPWGIFIDPANTIYVANRGNNSILVFTSGTLPSETPSATISGADTGLDNPTGVYVR